MKAKYYIHYLVCIYYSQYIIILYCLKKNVDARHLVRFRKQLINLIFLQDSLNSPRVEVVDQRLSKGNFFPRVFLNNFRIFRATAEQIGSKHKHCVIKVSNISPKTRTGLINTPSNLLVVSKYLVQNSHRQSVLFFKKN